MSAISVQLPNSLRMKLAEVARQEGVSVDQLVASAVAEKLSALMSDDCLHKRAARSSQDAFEQALSEIPDVEPEDYDRL